MSSVVKKHKSGPDQDESDPRIIRFTPGKGCQICRKLMAETKRRKTCVASLLDPIAETSVALEKGALKLLDTLDAIDGLRSGDPDTLAENAGALGLLEWMANGHREVFEKACDDWLKAWDAANGNNKNGKTADGGLSEIMETCLLLQLLPHSSEVKLHAANVLLESRGVKDSVLPAAIVQQLNMVHRLAQEHIEEK
ncbi:hypothetical protein MCOR25_007744 [Pyricularia grisea]|nr:hypothetical protein MCOR25_007744 [Pyricularia grisea]